MVFSHTLHINGQKFPYEYSAHANNILCGLNELSQMGSLFDITLIVEGQQFQAHRVVLASCSNYFRAMFTGNMKESKQNEVILQEIPAVGMKLVLDYIYTGSISLTPRTIEDTLSAANHLQIIPVLDFCCLYMKSHLNLENCVKALCLADKYCLSDVEKDVYIFICSVLLKFSETNKFELLNYKQILRIVSSDYPVDCSENDLLQVVLKWLFCVEHEEYKLTNHEVCHLLHYIKIPGHEFVDLLSAQKYRCINNDAESLKFVVNTRGLDRSVTLIGGVNSKGLTNDIIYFHVSSGKWRRLTTIPHLTQTKYGVAVLKNKLYVLGGRGTGTQADGHHPYGFCYDPHFNLWNTVARMPYTRCGFSLTPVRDKLYLVGGREDILDMVYLDINYDQCYDPKSNTWSLINPPPLLVSKHAATAYPENGTNLYISGGALTTSEFLVKTVWRYDTIIKNWNRCTDMIIPRANHVMLTIKDNIYVCGGWTSISPMGDKEFAQTVDVYIPHEDSWKTVTTSPKCRNWASIVAIEENIYFIGGYAGETFQHGINVIERYNVTEDTWKTCGSYPQNIYKHKSVSLYISRYRDDDKLESDLE